MSLNCLENCERLEANLGKRSDYFLATSLLTMNCRGLTVNISDLSPMISATNIFQISLRV